MMKAKGLSYFGLARRAGKLAMGDEAVLKAVRGGQALIVVVAEDASPNARKKYTDKCTYYGVRCVIAYSREQLGASLGRREQVVVAVTDAGLARLVTEALEI